MDASDTDTPSTRYSLIPEIGSAGQPAPESPMPRRMLYTLSRRSMLVALASFGLGAGGGYLYRDRRVETTAAPAQIVQVPTAGPPLRPEPTPASPIALPATHTAPAQFGQIGPQLLESGPSAYEVLAAADQQAGQPLTARHRAIRKQGSDAPVRFDHESAYFLLNFFWALGLTNRNPILLEGPLPQYAGDAIDRFASTGGWTAGTQPVTALYASRALVELTAEQQDRVEEVAAAVYRPCCDNPTLFPDCNHGMAMLGLLELVAANDVTTDELFTVAKHANAFWFPQQTLELAAFFRHTQGVEFADAEAKALVAQDVFSATGFGRVHQWLADNGRLQQAPDGGGSCSL